MVHYSGLTRFYRKWGRRWIQSHQSHDHLNRYFRKVWCIPIQPVIFIHQVITAGYIFSLELYVGNTVFQTCVALCKGEVQCDKLFFVTVKNMNLFFYKTLWTLFHTTKKLFCLGIYLHWMTCDNDLYVILVSSNFTVLWDMIMFYLLIAWNNALFLWALQVLSKIEPSINCVASHVVILSYMCYLLVKYITWLAIFTTASALSSGLKQHGVLISSQ